ncbi:MAG: TadE/TadG family type IV pilus assembly protein [Nitratireductor sp.]
MRIFSRFFHSRSGNFALIMAICAPVLFGMGGLATDYALLFNKRSDLQNLADAAALASAKELSIANMGDTEIEAVADEFVSANSVQPVDDGINKMTVSTEINNTRNGVKIKLSYEWTPFFAQLFDPGVTPIVVSASAELAGQGLSCVVGLMPPQKYAKSSIHLENKAILSADNCAVYANTDDPWAIRLDGTASLTAQSICSGGGVLKFGKPTVSPDPITDCPLIADPLASRTAPSFGACDETNYVASVNETIHPGVYCGGLTITNGARVDLAPGVYVISGGKLKVDDGATLQGTKIGFFLTGDDSLIDFAPNSTIDISAPETGPLAGLLFYEDRNVSYSFDFNPLFINFSVPKDVRLHRIKSNNARNLLGTIYLPRSILLIDSNAPVADASAYTAIVTGRLWLQAGPVLKLNADYSSTKVPVPGGLLGTTPRLVN